MAQLFGKPVYVITDVAFLPLSSRQDAVRAINAATEARKSREPSTDSEMSDSDPDDPVPSTSDNKTSSSPTDDEVFPPPRQSDTSIAQDVFVKRGQFGRFASQWFSKQGWGIGKATGQPQSVTAPADKQAELADDPDTAVPVAGDQQPSAPESIEDVPKAADREDREPTPVADMIPKILSASRLILASRSFFYSYEVDLTRSMASHSGVPQPPIRGKLDPLVMTVPQDGSGSELTRRSTSGIVPLDCPYSRLVTTLS